MLHRLVPRLSFPRASLRRPVMSQSYNFGPYIIDKSEVFATSPLSYAFVNLRPVVPGHVLISPKRVVERFKDMTSEEVSDVWLLAQKVGQKVEECFEADSSTLCIQDGASAGQTVPHVHIHCLPRRKHDFENNDEVYTRIEETSTERTPSNLNLDIERQDRTAEEMAEEAKRLRSYFVEDI